MYKEVLRVLHATLRAPVALRRVSAVAPRTGRPLRRGPLGRGQPVLHAEDRRRSEGSALHPERSGLLPATLALSEGEGHDLIAEGDSRGSCKTDTRLGLTIAPRGSPGSRVEALQPSIRNGN